MDKFILFTNVTIAGRLPVVEGLDIERLPTAAALHFNPRPVLGDLAVCVERERCPSKSASLDRRRVGDRIETLILRRKALEYARMSVLSTAPDVDREGQSKP